MGRVQVGETFAAGPHGKHHHGKNVSADRPNIAAVCNYFMYNSDQTPGAAEKSETSAHSVTVDSCRQSNAISTISTSLSGSTQKLLCDGIAKPGRTSAVCSSAENQRTRAACRRGSNRQGPGHRSASQSDFDEFMVARERNAGVTRIELVEAFRVGRRTRNKCCNAR